MKWKNTDNRIVAFIDIMGFKNWLQTHTHNTILAKMQKLSMYSEKRINDSEFRAHGTTSSVKTVIFSDSILIVSQNNTIASAINIMIKTSHLFNFCMCNGIPIKGCIASGKFTADFDNSLFFGQPLVDAYLLQDDLLLYSIILHHTFEANFKDKKYNGRKIIDSKRWFRYKTPLKGNNTLHYHQNWLFYSGPFYDVEKNRFYENIQGKRIIKERLEKFYSTVSGAPRQYVDNTIQFIDELIGFLMVK